MCLGCGYDGPLLQGDPGAEAWTCPSCSSDLYARPPRSYAEMEGFESADAMRGSEAGATLGFRRVQVQTLARRNRSRAPRGWWQVTAVLLGGVLVLAVGAAALAAWLPSVLK